MADSVIVNWGDGTITDETVNVKLSQALKIVQSNRLYRNVNFADILGINRNTLDGWAKGRCPLPKKNYDILDKIIEINKILN